MTEIRIHGRGGQGTVLASSVLAQALVEEGKYVVAVPSFGFERRGAPVAAFLRVSDREIRAMTNIYHPNIILCIDPTVGRTVDIFAGMGPGGTLVQSTKAELDAVKLGPNVAKVGLCDAVTIALKIFNKPITNSVMLGAFAKTTGMVKLDSLKAALETTEFRDAGLKQNMDAIAQGYEGTIVHTVGGHA